MFPTLLKATRAAAIATIAFITPGCAQPQVSPEMRSEAKALMHACRADYEQLCSGVSRGGGRILACLKAHAGDLSAGCADALGEAAALKDRAAAAGVLPK